MKRLYTFLLLLFAVVAQAQTFQYEVVSATTEERNRLDRFLTKYDIISLNTSAIKMAVRSQKANDIHFKLSLPSKGYDLALRENDLRGPGYKSNWTESSRQEKTVQEDCSTYQGIIGNNVKLKTRLLITDDCFSGFIITDEGYLYFDPINRFLDSFKTNDKRIIVYRAEDLKNDLTPLCNAVKLPQLSDEKKGINSQNARVPTTCRILEVATDADFEWFQRFGNNSNNQILNIINQFEAMYINEVNLRISVVFQNVFTTSADPYAATGAADGVQAINELRAEWQANRTNVSRDVVHLFTARNFTTGNLQLRGIHFQNVICNDPNNSYGLSIDGPYIVANTTAHELGHGFDANHPNEDGDPEQNQCQTATASVMCQGEKQFPPYFSAQQLQRVTNHINNNQNCLLNYDNLSISGPDIFCSTGIYSAIGPVNVVPSWSSSFNIGLNTTTGTTTTAAIHYDGSGWVQAELNIGCPIQVRKNVHVGRPNLQITGPEPICTNGLYQFGIANFTGMDEASYDWSTNSFNLYVSGNGTPVTLVGYSAGNYTLYATAQNTCGSTFTGIGVTVVDCFSGYRVYPNPAKEKLSITFDSFDSESALPDEILLLSEKSTVPVRIINVQEENKRGTLKDGNTIKIDVSDLSRGVYYLHIKNTRRKDKEIDAIRIALE